MFFTFASGERGLTRGFSGNHTGRSVPLTLWYNGHRGTYITVACDAPESKPFVFLQQLGMDIILERPNVAR